MEKIEIIGHIGQPAEVKTTQNGKSYLSFSVAVSKKRNNENVVTWYQCMSWSDFYINGKLKDFLLKGTQVYIEGEPSTRAYMNKTTSLPMVSNNIEIRDVRLLGKHEPNTVDATPVVKISSAPTPVHEFDNVVGDDDLPF